MTNTTEPQTATERKRVALDDVFDERQRQNAKWGVQRHSWPEWMAILGEEYGEACQLANWNH